MVGIYGNHPEDRAMANELAAYENEQAEAEMRAERIDAMADDIYRAKLAALPTRRKANIWTYTHIGDALSELDSSVNREMMIALGKAIMDDNEQEAGRLIIKLVTGHLRKEAQYEAENEAE